MTAVSRPFDVRRVSWILIGVACVAQLAASTTVNAWLFPSGLLRPLTLATNGLVRETLSANVLMMLVVIGIVVFAVGGLRPRDVGLRCRGIASAIAVLCLAWAFAQGWIALAATRSGAPIRFDESWIADAAWWTSGALLAQLAGNALFEEAFFRGFLLVQLAWLFAPDRSAASPGGRAIALAVLCSQSFFALTHVPNRLMGGQIETLAGWAGDQAILIAAGIAFAIIFLGMRNLWIAVVLHALGNRPTPLLAAPGTDDGTNAIAVVTIAFVVASIVLLIRRARHARPAPPISDPPSRSTRLEETS